MNVRRRQPRRLELILRRAPAVELPVSGTRARQEPARQPRRRDTSGFELRPHLITHFVARRADRRTDRGDEIARRAAELARQRRDGDGRDAGGQTAPPGVRGGDRAGDPIGEQQRHAVGGLNRQQQSAIVGNQDVGVRQRFSLAPRRIAGPPHHDGGAVHLAGAGQMREVDAAGLRELGPGRIAGSAGRRSERPFARREEMDRVRLQRQAHQYPPVHRLPPLKTGAVRQFGVVTPTLVNVAVAAAAVV